MTVNTSANMTVPLLTRTLIFFNVRLLRWRVTWANCTSVPLAIRQINVCAETEHSALKATKDSRDFVGRHNMCCIVSCKVITNHRERPEASVTAPSVIFVEILVYALFSTSALLSPSLLICMQGSQRCNLRVFKARLQVMEQLESSHLIISWLEFWSCRLKLGEELYMFTNSYWDFGLAGDLYFIFKMSCFSINTDSRCIAFENIFHNN